ncbi:MAG: bifunctional (p)ppGpp synthetase/guanosine-3',5'-bis(diphosphate) 3'-pyrophosphohydrolase [Lachnospiraceae bacterium]|nr:bifunctional (p)ppGpp synthetase/guanosine-3',5'-bis(diphosphate) 3'-pyrophosphohydrolase [Lachnospiraceae bacterium]
MAGFDSRVIDQIQEFQSPEKLYSDLILRVQKYHPSDDTSLIEKAYQTAYDAHRDQVRKSGEPYVIHPLCVAIILADLELDKETIIAGLLHDVVEDTVMTTEQIARAFGSDVAGLVDGVTKLTSLHLANHYSDKTAAQLEVQGTNLRKMFLAMAKDIRVILIKLADRLHNMRTLKYQSSESQRRIAQETLDIYSPIAERLGISRIKVELDDLSLKYLKPDVYADLVEKVEARKHERENYVFEIVEDVRRHIAAAGIRGSVDGRVKHYFSIYKKMRNQGKSLDQIYDLFAVRIIVDSVKDCYAALGIIHEMYKPIPGRFKDYIAMPKANNYQSLHTTLMGPLGMPFEIQIRTSDMHRAAEYGIAAHWRYKETGTSEKAADGVDREEAKLTWLRQILEWQQEMSDNQEFMNLLKSDLNLFSDDVYCFTPKGEVKNLPAGSTPIDFAYAVHSRVGDQMIGAKVNGKLVPIDYKIQNGDRVEVLTSPNSPGPSRDWLSIAQSTSARNKINQFFRRELKDENIQHGKELLLSFCRTKGVDPAEINKGEFQDLIVKRYGFHDWDSVLAAVGHGGLKEGQIINKLLELSNKQHRQDLTDEEVLAAVAEGVVPRISQSGNAILVKGVHDVAVRFSKCCNPVPGDDIVGFVTRGRGVTIHRRDCINIRTMTREDRTRLIEAEWEIGENDDEKYVADIKIYANDRAGLLNDISRMFTERGISILTMHTRISRQGLATLEMSFQVTNRDELLSVTEKIRQVPNVIDVERTSGG